MTMERKQAQTPCNGILTEARSLGVRLIFEKQAVAAGFFENAGKVVRIALREFLTRRRFELMEQQQLQDIAWALREKAQ